MSATKTVRLSVRGEDEGSKEEVTIPAKWVGENLAVHRPNDGRSGEVKYLTPGDFYYAWVVTSIALGLHAARFSYLADARKFALQADSWEEWGLIDAEFGENPEKTAPFKRLHSRVYALRTQIEDDRRVG